MSPFKLFAVAILMMRSHPLAAEPKKGKPTLSNFKYAIFGADPTIGERIFRDPPKDAIKEIPEWPMRGGPAFKILEQVWQSELREKFFDGMYFADWHVSLYDWWVHDRSDGRRDVKTIESLLDRMSADANGCLAMAVETEILKERLLALQKISAKKSAAFRGLLAELRLLGPYAEAKIRMQCKAARAEQIRRFEENLATRVDSIK